MKIDILAPVHTYPHGNSDNFGLHVAAIAQHLNADVHALMLHADFPHVSSVLGDMLVDVSSLMSDAKAKSRDRGSVLIQAMELEMKRIGISLRTTEVKCFEGIFGDTVTSHARYHDLVVVGIGPDDTTMQETTEAAIFGSGRPTLLVPDSSVPATFEHVMIAWDGSRVAARAVSDARDFLQRAQTITIASVTDEKPLPHDDPDNRLAEYFTRHDIEATVAQVQGRGHPIAETLQEHAREIGAGMLVMGAFGHSRIRDFVLGGATNGILKDLRLPVLLSH